MQIGSDIIRLIGDALRIIGPARRKERRAEAPAVQRSFIKASRRGVQRGAPDRLGKQEGLRQVRAGRQCQAPVFGPARRRRADPMRPPIGRMQQPHLPCPQRTAQRTASVFVPDLHLPEAARAGSERQAVVTNGDGIARQHFAAVPEIAGVLGQRSAGWDRPISRYAVCRSPRSVRLQLPTEARADGINSEWAGLVFAGQMGGCQGDHNEVLKLAGLARLVRNHALKRTARRRRRQEVPLHGTGISFCLSPAKRRLLAEGRVAVRFSAWFL